MAKNEKEVNVDKAWFLFKNIIDNTKRNDELKEAYKAAATPEEKAKIVKYARDNVKQLNYAKKEIESLKEYGTVGMGKVFHEFGKKAIKEEGAEGAKFLFKKIAKYMPGASAVAGIMTAFATDDASAAIPVLSEAESVGPEKDSPEYKYESGESKSIEMPKEDIKSHIEAIKAMQKARTEVKEPQYTSPIQTQEVPEVEAACGAVVEKNKDLHAAGGFVDGEENQYAGDTIPARLNKGEMVLNVEQQQNLLNKLKNKESKSNKGERVDSQINSKKIDIDESTQRQLFDYIKGESSEKPQGEVIKKFEEGTFNASADETAPIITPPPVQVPTSMQYTGPSATSTGTLPVAAAEIAPEEVQITPQVQAPASVGTSTPPTPTVPVETPVVAEKKTTPKDEVIKNIEKRVVAESALKASVAEEAAAKAQSAVQNEIIKKDADDARILENARQDMLREDGAMKEEHQTAAGKFFSSASTPEKILMGAALALSIPVMIITGKNPALDYMLNSVESDLAQQKLKTDQYLAKKNFYLDLQKQAISKQAQASSSEQAKVNAKHTLAQIDAIKSDIATQRAKLKLDQARGAREQGEFDLKLRAEQDHQKMVEDYAAKGQQIPISMLPKQSQENAKNLREEYNQQTKDLGTRKVMTNFQQIKAMTERPSGPGDISMVYNFMKSLDPNSTVREGEYANAQNAGPKAAYLARWYNKLVDGELFTEADRKAFFKAAKTLAKKTLDQHEGINRRYESLANQYAVPSSAIIEKFDTKDLDASSRDLLLRRYEQSGYNEKEANKLIDNMIAKGTLSKEKYGK